ncbi:hypothetical protein WA538_003221 [Blastocystis sp. DL]
MDGLAYVMTLTLIAVLIMSLYLFVAIRLGNHIIRHQMLLDTNGKSDDYLDERKESITKRAVYPELNMEASRWDDYGRLHSLDSPVADHYSFYFDSSASENEGRMFDYRSETWVDEYMSVKRLLEEESSTTRNEYYDKLWEESAGYSHIIATPSYAIVTNVCVNTKDEFITLHLKNEKTLSNLLSKYDRKDFYFNTVRVLKTPLNPTKMVSSPLRLAVLHPSSLSHPYQFLEGSSLLSFIALHPDQFPQLDQLLLLGGRNADLSSLTSFLLRSMLSLFPETTRPKLRFLNDASFPRQKNVCDRWIVPVSSPSNPAFPSQLGRRLRWLLLRNPLLCWNDAGGGICVRACVS